MPLAGCFTFLSCFCGFAILRSREPPDCGSFGNALIVCYLFLHSGTLYQFQSCVIFLAGDRSILFLRRPDHFQQVLISSPACALIRFYVTILISMPIGHWVRTIFGGVQASFGYCFHSPTHCSGFFHASNLTFLLPRSAYIVSMFYGWIFTRIASSKVPFLTLLRSRSRFSGGSLV